MISKRMNGQIFDKIIELACERVEDEHPMVRFEAIKTIEIYLEMGFENFSKEKLNKIIRMFAHGLEDVNERVVGCWLSCSKKISCHDI